LPEFDVMVVTVRSGTHTVRVEADDAAAARKLIQTECDANEGHCPPESCRDDVESTVTDVRQVMHRVVPVTGARGTAQRAPVRMTP
jgi:hypothetical protein